MRAREKTREATSGVAGCSDVGEEEDGKESKADRKRFRCDRDKGDTHTASKAKVGDVNLRSAAGCGDKSKMRDVRCVRDTRALECSVVGGGGGVEMVDGRLDLGLE